MNLWNFPGVPQKGWSNVGIDDEGFALAKCEMCGFEEVRYVHVMQHDGYPNRLRVGCVCAERMSEGYNARERQAEMVNRAARRERWLSRGWRLSQKGNHYLRLGGRFLTVFPDKYRRGKWRYSIDKAFSPDSYDSADAAKLALFDEYERLVRW